MKVSEASIPLPTSDVRQTLEHALIASGLDTANVRHRPRLLSDNGSSYIANDLATGMDDHKMKHVRGAPYHPMTPGKSERWHQTMNNRLLLEHYYLPGGLEAQIASSQVSTKTGEVHTTDGAESVISFSRSSLRGSYWA